MQTIEISQLKFKDLQRTDMTTPENFTEIFSFCQSC